MAPKKKSLKDFLTLPTKEMAEDNFSEHYKGVSGNYMNTLGHIRGGTNKVIDLIASETIYLPLTAPLARRMMADTPKRIEAFHVTNISEYGGIEAYSGVDWIARIENTSKPISCFTRRSGSVFSGVQHGGGVFLHVEGLPLLANLKDSFTVIDEDGYRWVEARYLRNSKRPDEQSARSQIIEEAKIFRMKFLGKHAPKNFVLGTDTFSSWRKLWSMFYAYSKLSPASKTLAKTDVSSDSLDARTVVTTRKSLGALMKEYIDGLQALMSKYKDDILRSELFDQKQRSIHVGEFVNEVALSHIKVLGWALDDATNVNTPEAIDKMKRLFPNAAVIKDGQKFHDERVGA